MKTEYSCGVVVTFKEKGQYLFLLVQANAGHWAFPKGHKETGETDKETALRELKEETGITEITLDERRTFTEQYQFVRNQQRHHKAVTYFVGASRTKSVVLQRQELKDFCWLDYDKARECITFRESRKEILDKVYEYLS